ncbi:putative bifunctional diguanylate cyclase/phosphodiesterase [Thiocystis violacea]|uniref:putative bifunctional diguanylate cyclase/phosphodiesterase n=1 Tax=Thiocystis violacea TaxID=13725 RepID=UPI0030B88B13
MRQLVVPTFVIDGEARVIVWNRACEQLTGMPAADVIGTRDHWRAFYRKPRPCLADLVLQGRQADIRQYYSACPDGADTSAHAEAHAENWCVMPLCGAELYLSVDAGPIKDAEGRTIAVVETLRDMTDRHRAEQKLRFIASVFENSQEGILITAPDARILDVNAAFTRTTGYGREEVLGRTPALLKSGIQEADFYRRMWRDLKDKGHWQGEVWNRRKSGEIYPELLQINAVLGESGQLSHYIGMFLDISDLKSTQQQLLRLASYDALTHLPNRRLLARRLHRAMDKAARCERLVAICSIDLDDFKGINDRFGQEHGDRLLLEIARRLLGVLRPEDTAARLGGDEFVLLVTDLGSADELEEILRRVFEEISAPYQIEDVAVTISASIGVTLYPIDDSDPDTLLRHADYSMYEAKQLGRNRYQLFDMEAARALRARHLQLERLRKALRDREFCLYYQPKVNMRTGRVMGMEALLRWRQANGVLVGPMEFLPLAEQSSLIVDIGEWVLREALGQARQWVLDGLDLTVSVNIAARHFQHGAFLPRLRAILSEHADLAPHHLELEILESAALEDIAMMRGIIGACQSIGVGFALDDFGTGYSSLSYLKQLPVETLKIDRSFVRDMLDDQDDLAITKGVIGLASVFRRQVIAEGVETPEQGLLLMDLGCDRAQGFGIGRPMPPEQVPGWIEGFEPDWKWTLWAGGCWRSSDMPLLLAQYDCRHWLERLVDRLDGCDGERREKFPVDGGGESSDGRFSTWLAGEGDIRHGHLLEFKEVARLHDRIRRLGSAMIRLRDAGKPGAARAMRDKLIGLKTGALTAIEQLQRRVARR